MNEQFTSPARGTLWLSILNYGLFPLNAAVSAYWLVAADYSSMPLLSKISIIMFYGFFTILYCSSVLQLHKKSVSGYYLAFLAPFVTSASNLFVYFLTFSVSNPTQDNAAYIAGAFVLGCVNYVYLRKRRYLFGNVEHGPMSFSLIGARTALAVLGVFTICMSIYAISFIGTANLTIASYEDLQARYDSTSAELESISLELEVAKSNNEVLQNQVDLYLWLSDDREKYEQFMNDHVRFVTKTGEKYHLYQCSIIENADSIYYLFNDDLSIYDYSPCSLCDPD